jgi:hypothetical protein
MEATSHPRDDGGQAKKYEGLSTKDGGHVKSLGRNK